MRGRLHIRSVAVAGLSLVALMPAAGQVPADTAVTRDSAAVRDSVVVRDTTPQVALRFVPRPGVFAGSDQEEQLRTLQLLGVVAPHQWSLRALGPRELARLAITDTAGVPASLRRGWCSAACAARRVGSVRGGVLPVEASVTFNSTHPFGMNDGPVWTGRGVTVAARGGVHGTVGPVSIIVAPTFFIAQNQEFPLEPNGLGGELRFADAMFPREIDNPQRFGDAAHIRLDPGESSLRIDVAGMAAGIASGAQWWGPMSRYPYVLGNNAGGFPHAFVGTAAPVGIGIGRLHARVMYGALAQSAYSIMPRDSSTRLASGIIAVFQPRGLDGLEVGAGRFFASIWPADGIALADLAKPFEGLLKSSRGLNPDGGLIDDVHNQIASVFARLTLPASGVELYGEYGRDDHSADARDFWLEPDHDATFGLGLRRAWRSEGARASVFRAEFVNFRISHLERVRPQLQLYVHAPIRQGHTHRGQALGIGIGGRSGDVATISLNRFAAGGAHTFSLARHSEAGIGEGKPRLVRIIAVADRSLRRGPMELVGSVGVSQRVGRDDDRGRTNLMLSLRSLWIPALGR